MSEHSSPHGPGTGPNGQIVLAREPAFQVGPLTIEPSLRRVASADGREEVLEHRVMQVLVLLLRADGATLHRDDLIYRCWDGRIVGDDAIHRVMSRLRRSAEGIGRGVFRIETVTKVGYRLVREDRNPLSSAPPTSAPSPAIAPAGRRPWLAWAGGSGLLTLVAAAVYFGRPVGPVPIPVVAVRSEVQGAEAAALAGGLAADLSQLAANHAAELAVVDAPQSDSADYLLRVAAGRSSTALHAELTLISRASGELLWSASVDSPLNALVDLRQQLAVRTADVLLCALHGTRVNGDRLDTATLRLFLTFCENDHDEHDSRQLDVIRQVTARAPDFAAGWADLAVTEAYLGQPGSESGFRDFPAKAAFRAASRDHLLRARAMDPALSGTYFAEALLVIDPQQWSRRLAIIDRGIIVTSDASLYDLRSDDLGRVGRLNEAVDSARNAVELDPLSPAHRRTLAGWLAYSGRIEAANLVIREMERTWPGSEVSRAARFNFDLRFGNARHALAMLDDGDNDRLSPQARDLDRLYLRARIDSSAANIQSVLGAIGPGLPDASPISYLQLQALGYFGRIDKAYALLNAPAFRARLLAAPDILFRTQMRSIVRDPRFLPLSRRMGLLDYWRRTGQWPDFCAEPGLPYDCRAEAARLAA